jgi:deazaflavin-dependent oxidoreductase (nitroreductase family)
MSNNMHEFNQKMIKEFRENKGKVGGNFANTPLLLLHTLGAKSGQHRTNPLAYVKDGDHYIVIASKGGAPSHPAWYHNVVANPDVTVEVDGEKFRAKAHAIKEGSERDRLFAKMVAKNPGFAGYEKATTRKIPAISLTRVK